jgi:hypothetical protein
MVELLLPALFLATRLVVSECAARALARRLTRARQAAVRVINGMLASTLVNVGVNVCALLAATEGLRHRLPQDQLVLVVASVYAASVLHAGLKLVSSASSICELSRCLLQHGVHGPRQYLRSHVAREIHAHFQAMGLWRRLAYRLSGAPHPSDLVEVLTREIWKLVAVRVAALATVVILYIAIFTLYTRPLLLEETTRLDWLQAFLWPFGYSVDYFFGTGITAWINDPGPLPRDLSAVGALPGSRRGTETRLLFLISLEAPGGGVGPVV